MPMPIEMVDLYEALRRGVVDGNYGPLEQLKGFKIGEVEKYVTASWKVGSVFSFYLVMNKNKWNSLPPDVQKTITEYRQGVPRPLAGGMEHHRHRGAGVLLEAGRPGGARSRTRRAQDG